jgi:hypothetical protein
MTLVLLFAGLNCFVTCAGCTNSSANAAAHNGAPCHEHKMPQKDSCPHRLVLAQRSQPALHTQHVSTQPLHFANSLAVALPHFQDERKIAAAGNAPPPRNSRFPAILRI